MAKKEVSVFDDEEVAVATEPIVDNNAVVEISAGFGCTVRRPVHQQNELSNVPSLDRLGADHKVIENVVSDNDTGE